MRYAFIGLGNLGRHLALSLISGGFDVTVCDLRKETAADHLAAGAKWAATPAEAARNCDALITCLPSPAASTGVMLGENGALAAMPAGATWIEMSTNDGDEIARIAGLAAARNVTVLEAPVTGGVHRAEAGEITVLVGGALDVYERHRPVLEAMGGDVIHMGELGKASVIKVITNMLAFIHLCATGEALMLAKCGGVDLTKAFVAIKASSGNSFVHETEGQVILNGSYDIGFTMDLTLKDIGFATGYGREFGVPLKLAGLVEQIFVEGRGRYGGDAWSSQIVKLLEDTVGQDLRAPGFPARLGPEHS